VGGWVGVEGWGGGREEIWGLDLDFVYAKDRAPQVERERDREGERVTLSPPPLYTHTHAHGHIYTPHSVPRTHTHTHQRECYWRETWSSASRSYVWKSAKRF
jgi:hypothetical protein